MSMFFRDISPAGQPASTVCVETGPLAATTIPRTLLLWLAFGVAGAALFPITYLIEGATRPGYDAWRDTISALSFGPMRWVQQVNFALCGVSVLCLLLSGARSSPVASARPGIPSFVGSKAWDWSPLRLSFRTRCIRSA